MFEAIHGSAPDIAGQDVANPSGLLLAACMMLDHAGRGEAASLIRNAWSRAVEDGVATRDMGGSLGTRAFTGEVVARLGEAPRTMKVAKPAPRLEIVHPSDVVAVASRVAILRGGRKIADVPTSGLDADRLAHMVMLG